VAVPSPVELDRSVLDPRDPDATTRDAIHAWIAFAQRFKLRPEDGRAALAAGGGDPRRALDTGAFARLRSEGARSIEALARAGARVVPLGAAAYPSRLAAIPDAPSVLFVRGELAALAAPSVALVGARRPSSYGRDLARDLGRGLAASGLAVVSGLALGVDAAGHRGALETPGGITLAIQGCGLDVVYPAPHRRLAEAIVAQGAIVSEFPPGTPPFPHHFPLRNRLISGLGLAVIVVEARLSSGSISTALHAAAQGREVFAVPGPITADTSEGTNRLLRDGAHVLTGLDDVLCKLGLPPRAARARQAAASADDPALSHEAASLLRSLARAPATRDELARRLAGSVSSLETVLLELELAGRIRLDRDGRLRVVVPST
jgi:DNA processing protein